MTDRSEAEDAGEKQRQSSEGQALEAALEAARAVLKREEFPVVARSVFDLCKSLLGATAGYVALLSPDGAENEVLFLDAGGLPCDVDPALPMSIRGLRAEAYRTAKAVYENDFAASPWAGLLPEGHARLENVLFAPLNLESKTVGLLGLANKPGGFTEHDARMASAFAEIAAIAMMNSRTFEALRGSEARYRALTQSAADAIISVDAAGNVVSWNRAAEEMFGRAQREMLGKPLDAIIPLRFWKAHCEAMRRIASTGESKLIGTTVEIVAQRSDGTEFPVELSLSAWETQEGRFFTGILRDITERKRTEEALRQSEQRRKVAEALEAQRKRFHNVLNMLPAYVVLLSPDYRVPFANRFFEERFGKSEGRRCHEYLFQRTEPCEKCETYRVLKTGEPHRWEWTGPDDRNYDIYDFPFTDADGSPLIMEVGLDLTEVKRAQAALQEANETLEQRVAERTEALQQAKAAAEAASVAKSQFLANMSHEIRTPMTAILGFTDLLMAYDVPASERREHLQTIHRNAQNLLTLVNDILDLAKIEAEQVELEPADCPPHAVVEEVRSLMQLRAHEKSLGLQVTYEAPLPPTIRTDATRLRQILMNLVGNAIKFTPSGRVGITVRSAPADEGPARIQFEVADTGIGMTAEEQARLFRPFTQADMSHARRIPGTGLGLSISQKLAGLLGGHIDVKSEPGQGSTFTLTIPCGPAPAGLALPGAAAAPPRPHRVRLSGSVLLAEDDPDVRALLSRILAASGLQVDTAEDGQIAWEKASSSKAAGRAYDMILMDCQMPELDGYELSRRLRREGWAGPILALTAHAMTGDREKCLEAGCDDYLSKPMSAEALLGKVAEHLGQAGLKYPSASSTP